MSVYLVIFIASTVFSSVVGFCQLSDCLISDASECSWVELVEDNFNAPAEQNMSQMTDLDHLFNFLFNPFERDCVRINFSKPHLIKAGNFFDLTVYCGSKMVLSIHLTFLVQFHQPSNGSLISFIKRDEIKEFQGKKCDLFAHEQFSLTFMENNDQLLIEDLSSIVPRGTRLILRKTDGTPDRSYQCQDLITYRDEKTDCLNKPKKASGNGTKKITGSVVGLLFLLALLFTCNMCFKLKFLYGFEYFQ